MLYLCEQIFLIDHFIFLYSVLKNASEIISYYYVFSVWLCNA